MERPGMKNLTDDHIRRLSDWYPFHNFHILIPAAHIYVVVGTMFTILMIFIMDQDSSVGIVTRYGLHGLWIESR
jgi:hypothetical protein